MSPTSTFRTGGVITILLGVSLAVGLVWAGAGLDYLSAYVGVAFAIVLGTFFLYVGRKEEEVPGAPHAAGEPATPAHRTPPS